MNKIIPLDQFISLRESIKKKIILVGGCFDVFHYGHLIFLKKAKQQGDVLVILLESDAAIRARKKKRAFHNQRERAEILASVTYVDYIIPIGFLKDDASYLRIIRQLKPTIIAVSEGDPQLKNKKRQAKLVGCEVITVTPLIKKFSSTKIKNYAPLSSD